jgi:hypothetical protein
LHVKGDVDARFDGQECCRKAARQKRGYYTCPPDPQGSGGNSRLLHAQSFTTNRGGYTFGDTLFKSKIEIIEQLHGDYLRSRHWHIVGRDGPLVVIERDDNKLTLSIPVGRAIKGNFGSLL